MFICTVATTRVERL